MARITKAEFEKTVSKALACQLCAAHLPFGPRPIFQLDAKSKILIAGQAPGRRVHETGIPFDDPSGERLRLWMGIDSEIFYDPRKVAILPMGFRYPGTGKSGDLPPRPECAIEWRGPLLKLLRSAELTIVIGQYALDWHLGDAQKGSLTETVRNWKQYWPAMMPLPHPSPRNNIWLKKNPWFETEIVPTLRRKIKSILST